LTAAQSKEKDKSLAAPDDFARLRREELAALQALERAGLTGRKHPTLGQ
jgi:hypothetical protein